MREIKFRYRIQNEPGYRVHTLDEIERGALAGLFVLARDEWTGCTDTNGVEIFVGDLCENRYGGTAKVEKHSGAFWFCHQDGWESETRCDSITMHKMGMTVTQSRPVPPRAPLLRVV